MPRYLKASQFFTDSPPKVISIPSMPWRCSLCYVPKTINSVFFRFKRSLFPQSHSDRLVSSIFNFSSTSINCAEEKKMTVSSAYMITLEKFMHDGRSLIYNESNTGPRMLPWGTPFSTAKGLDLNRHSFLGIQTRRHCLKYLFTAGGWFTLSAGWGGYHQSLVTLEGSSSGFLSGVVDHLNSAFNTHAWSGLGSDFFQPSGRG